MKHKVADYIKVDGTITRLPATVAKMPFDEVQAMVHGYIEHALGSRRTEVWCNENGVAEGLLFNRIASQRTGHNIVGDAIVESWE